MYFILLFIKATFGARMQTLAHTSLLTKREIEIVVLIADGFENPEIATQLGLSVLTVNTHRKNILRKLNLKNTALLIRYAMENHLLVSAK